mmetsp:Transcript_28390/g.92717  ORF Transcript_28390/g.92717 Transcript_28390/m.92717 type:complete len:248 (-) Transcript_28390:533-1276(-)
MFDIRSLTRSLPQSHAHTRIHAGGGGIGARNLSVGAPVWPSMAEIFSHASSCIIAPNFSMSAPPMSSPTRFGVVFDRKTRVLDSSHTSVRVNLASGEPHVPVLLVAWASNPAFHLSMSSTSIATKRSGAGPAGASFIISGGGCSTMESSDISLNSGVAMNSPNLGMSTAYIVMSTLLSSAHSAKHSVLASSMQSPRVIGAANVLPPMVNVLDVACSLNPANQSAKSFSVASITKSGSGGLSEPPISV